MRHILYVDDEPALCKAFERALRAPEHRVVTTTSAPEAVHLLENGDFDVVATDYRMPGIDGLGVLKAARERVPGAKRLLVSGQADSDVEERAIRDAGVDDIVQKPWSLDNLRRVVRRAAENAELARENARLAARSAALEEQLAALAAHGRSTAERVREAGARLGLAPEAIEEMVRLVSGQRVPGSGTISVSSPPAAVVVS